MNKRFVNTTIILVLVFFFGTLSLFLKSWFARPPAKLGVSNGHLANCNTTPNCVCSQAYNTAQNLKPIQYSGDSQRAIALLSEIITDMPRSKLIDVQHDYLRAEFTSRVFGFVDDVEFHVVPTNALIHFRSASRMGYSDFGVNRQRMLQIIKRFDQLNKEENNSPNDKAG